MKDEIVLTHEFVEFIPEGLRDRTIYVSIKFATASHKCCCGCGQKVVTPLRPTDWKLIFDGKTVSLDPSIGNWGFQCRSHYWIRNNRVRWAAEWSQGDVEAGRSHDRYAKMTNFNPPTEVAAGTGPRSPKQPERRETPWRRFKKWLQRSSHSVQKSIPPR